MVELAETDEIHLDGMRFYGYHGVHPEERKLGQRFRVDVALGVDLRPAGRSDDLTQTVSYSAAWTEVRRIVEGEPRNLIEAVAEEIAATLLALDARIAWARVRVAKLEVPIRGSLLDAASVVITRRRAAEGGEA
ncbi:MAG: dihydroneopterin aldolase [Thermomicrobiales bacterium]